MGTLAVLVGGFASGVFLRSLIFTNIWPFIFALLLSAIFITVPRILRAYTPAPLESESSSPLMGLAAVFCLLLALGGLRAALAETLLPSAFAADLKHRVTYDAVVVGDPDLRDANQRVELLVTSGDAQTKMLAVAPRSPVVQVGDTVSVSGTLAVPEPFVTNPPVGGGRVFRYDKYLQRDGVRFMLNFAYLRVEKSAPWYSLPAMFARIKHVFIDGLNAALPEPYASLASGIVIGGKSGLGADLQNAFVKSGLVQIIVLSGYNVMVVAAWIMSVFAFFKASRRTSAVAGAVALILFVGVAGFTATAIRAMLMALISLYALATSRTYAASRALLFVVFLMLLWNPLYLAFDPGFGLSVAATAGLIWLAPLVIRLLTGLAPFWQEAIATTLAAQIAVLPLLLYDTGNLSLVAIPANVLVMPLVPLAMAMSALAGIAGMLFGHLIPLFGITLGFPAYLATLALIEVARVSTALPYATFTLPAFPFWLTLAAYAALAYTIARLNRSSTTLQFTFAKKAST